MAQVALDDAARVDMRTVDTVAGKAATPAWDDESARAVIPGRSPLAFKPIANSLGYRAGGTMRISFRLVEESRPRFRDKAGCAGDANDKIRACPLGVIAVAVRTGMNPKAVVPERFKAPYLRPAIEPSQRAFIEVSQAAWPIAGSLRAGGPRTGRTDGVIAFRDRRTAQPSLSTSFPLSSRRSITSI